MKFVLLFLPLIVAVSCDPGATPTIPYINLWTDEAGETHLSECELHEFNLTSFSTAAKQYVSTDDMPTKRYVFNIFPTDWFGDWHPAPSLQWVVTLSGSWFVRASDGSMVDLPTGSIIFNNDSNATLGHQSSVSEYYKTASVLVVQVTNLPQNIPSNKCSAGGIWIRDIPKKSKKQLPPLQAYSSKRVTFLNFHYVVHGKMDRIEGKQMKLNEGRCSGC